MEAESGGLTLRRNWAPLTACSVSDEATYPATSLFPVNHRQMNENVGVWRGLGSIKATLARLKEGARSDWSFTFLTWGFS